MKTYKVLDIIMSRVTSRVDATVVMPCGDFQGLKASLSCIKLHLVVPVLLRGRETFSQLPILEDVIKRNT